MLQNYASGNSAALSTGESGAGFGALLSKCPGLTSLHLYNMGMTANALEQLGKALPAELCLENIETINMTVLL